MFKDGSDLPNVFQPTFFIISEMNCRQLRERILRMALVLLGYIGSTVALFAERRI